MAEYGKRTNSNSDVPEDKRLRIADSIDEEEHSDTDKEENKMESDTTETKKGGAQDQAIMTQILDSMKNLECLPAMKHSLEQIKEDMTQLKLSLAFTQNEMDTMKKKFEEQKAEITELRKKMVEIDHIKKENNNLKKQLTDLEAYGRRENLIFENVPEKQGEDCEVKIRNLLKKKLSLKDADSFKIQRVHRLGQKNSDNTRSRDRPIIVRFAFFPERQLVWNSRKLLQGTNIIMREDFPEQVEAERRTLVPILMAAKKIPDVKARLVANKLYVNSQQYSVDTLHLLPEPVAPRTVSEKRVQSANGGAYHLFGGRLSPFSNFHEAASRSAA